MRVLAAATGLAVAAILGLAPVHLGASSAHAALTPQGVADDLLAADRGFSAAAATRPAANAIAAMLDDDVVMFIVPQPPLVRGKAQAQDLLAKAFAGPPSTLSWAPVRAGVSADGTQGFTYGFASRATPGKDPALSKYVAYWVKRPEGWRVAAFKLVPRPDGEAVTAMRPPALPEAIVAPADAAQVKRYRAELDAAERAFSDESQVIGIGPAFTKFGSADAMNVAGGADFTYGNQAIGASFGNEPGSPLTWAPDGVVVAGSGDLGITYGYLQRTGEVPPGRLARIPWFTIWRRASPQHPWRYVAE
jgi:ketosteroid isomerase-like protein